MISRLSSRSWQTIGVIVICYAAFALAWIYFSDRAVEAIANSSHQLTRLQQLKGGAFVLFSAGLIGALLWRELRRRDALQHQLERANRAWELVGTCRLAIARTVEEDKLLQEFCTLAVVGGGYRASRMGRGGPGTALQWVAQAGETGPSENPATLMMNVGQTALREQVPVVRRGRVGATSQSEHLMAIPVEAGERDGDALVWVVTTDVPTGFDGTEQVLLRRLADELGQGLAARRMQAALRRAEEEFRVIFTASPLPMWLFDAETLRFLAVNEAAVAHYGYSREEFLNMTIKDIRPAEDVPALLVAVGRKPEGFDRAGVWRHRCRDGRILLVEITTHTIEFRGRRAELVLANDVTERMAAETALRESEARLRLAVAAAELGTFEWDIVQDRLIWSREHEALWGYRPGEFAGRYADFAARVHPEDRPRIEAEVARCQQQRTLYDCEFRVVWPDQSVHWIAGYGQFEFAPDGRPLRMRGVVQEITARKQAEAELRASRERLRELASQVEATREEERTRIAREVHDVLGQLLTGLKLDLAWLDRRCTEVTPPELQQRMRQRLREATELADSLIREVQQISSDLRPSVLDTLGLPAAVRFEAQRFARRSGLSCEVEAAPDQMPLPPEMATQAFRILQEALTNVARHAQASRVHIRLEPVDGHLVLEVRDDGRGLRQTDRDAATGLGLLGMQERARRIGAKLRLGSTPGEGTWLRLQIPLPPPQPAGARAGDGPDPAPDNPTLASSASNESLTPSADFGNEPRPHRGGPGG
jgi:PAS domain S-box-containing protein